MKRRAYLLAALMVVCLNAVRAQEENVVELDLNTDTVTSTQGVDVKYGNVNLKAFEMKRNENENKAYIVGDFFVDAEDPAGNVELEATNGEISLDGKEGEFGKNFGSIEVGKVTGAEAPNDKVYFGGDSVKYNQGNVYINNGWATTDPSIQKTKQPNSAGYHFQTENISIEPDKQITFRNSDLYLGSTDIIPFTLPWYRTNIRRGSKVPLFPSFGTEEDYGWNISWGLLYGDRESQYKGGFAPKLATDLGLLIGRWENWYETKNYGTAKLDITDLLVYKKNSGADDRWDIQYTHEYDGEYGNFNLNLRNATYNMVSSLNDIIDDYDAEGRFNPNSWNYVGQSKPYKGSAMTFLTLDSDLKGMGENKDITFKGEAKFVDDKNAYKLIADDVVDGQGYFGQSDNSLFVNTELYKDNERYKIGGYYNYLYDPTPGANPNILQSRTEDFGFEIIDKKYRLNLKYDERNGDKYRLLNSWERDPNLNDRALGTQVTSLGDYVPWTISQYDIYDNSRLDISAGDYHLAGDFKFKTGYTYKWAEEELSLQQDPFRRNVILGNERDKEYNRYENVIYSEGREDKGYVEISSDYLKLTFAGGKAEEEFWYRKGIYNYDVEGEGTSYYKYINHSDFYEFSAGAEKLSLGRLGNLDILGAVRYDEYTKGYNPYTQSYASGSDSTLRSQAGLTYRVDFTDSINNEFSYFYQKYNYDSGDINFGSGYDSKDIRLTNKYNKQKFEDTINFEIGDVEIKYNISYQEDKRAANENKASEVFKNDVEISKGDKISLKLNYDQDKRYDDSTLSGNNYNDLTLKNYGASFGYGANRFYYKNQSIDSNIWDLKPIDGVYADNSKEKIKEDIFGYEFKRNLDVLTLEYTQGKDRRHNYTTGNQEIDSTNKIYDVTYLKGGDVEQRFKGSYLNYNYEESVNSRLSSDGIFLRYDYRDKRFSEEELRRYAAQEYNKPSDQLTSQEIEKIRNLLANREKDRNNLSFDLRRAIDSRVGAGEYKESLTAWVYLQKNKERYSQTGNYWDSLEDLEASLFYSKNRYGLGYKYEQESGYTVNSGDMKWADFDKNHEVSLHAKLGKPSEGWRIKTYAKFYDGLKGNPDVNRKKRLDGFGIEIGKEIDYYEWSIAVLREYSTSSREYEWQTALQFSLLTFPDMPIFGLGADKKKSVSPDVRLFNGLKVDSID